MIHTEIATETTTVKKSAGVTCDCCKQKFPNAHGKYGRGTYGAIDWELGGFDTAETEIRISVGHCYPPDGSGDKNTREWHICPKCFSEKVEPALIAVVGEPIESEIDW